VTLRSLLAGCGTLLLAACGWRAGLPVPADARTLAVTFPANDSPLRDLELDFGVALAEAALDRLDLQPEAPEAADLVVRGRVIDFQRRSGIRTPRNRLLETGDEIELELWLVDGRSGATLRTVRRQLESGFAVELLVSPARTPEEALARRRVVRNLAEGLLLELFDPLAYEAPGGGTEQGDGGESSPPAQSTPPAGR
jgi:hypothetical protein